MVSGKKLRWYRIVVDLLRSWSVNKYIDECLRGSWSLHTSKNFTSDNECSQQPLSIIFLGTQTPKVGHESYFILPTPIYSPQAHVCYLSTHITTHTPPIPHTTQKKHSQTDTDNPQEQTKHKPTDGRMDTDRHSHIPTDREREWWGGLCGVCVCVIFRESVSC